ncbi:MAG: M23 family metallopeptidase [Candidatus Eisenbacteria bacterium]|nr:M23 family metallopeptidase [Candidatus Eisenbacteria bacterium]
MIRPLLVLALAAALAQREPAPQYFPPVVHPPLDPPLGLSGTFGEYRGGHFHAGLDLSTDEEIGHPVYAALPGRIVRVRSSGVGYGRSIYLAADDGRLLVYGHLDAFDEPLASYMDSVQATTARYEQDQWPDSTRFRVVAGQRLGWSGRSGTGPPHLHFEIRRGDVAYNPLLAGVSVADTTPPMIRQIVVDPLDLDSTVEGDVVPVTRATTGAADTFAIGGSARMLVGAADVRANGALAMAPWRVRVSGEGGQVECRFDSISWAEGMSEVDWVYDRGLRSPGSQNVTLLWAPAGFRPRVLGASAGPGLSAGTVRAGTLRVEVEDAAGNLVVREVSLLPGPPAAARDRGAPRAPGERAGLRRFRALDLTWAADAQQSARAELGSGLEAVERGGGRLGAFRWDFGPRTFFEAPSLIGSCDLWRLRSSGELRGAGGAVALHPVLLPVRTPFRIAAAVPWPPARSVGLYRDSGGGWEWIGARADSATRELSAETRRLGRFALLRDLEAPRIGLLPPPRTPPRWPYPHWALEAKLDERGSGVDAGATFFMVDGERVPSEWDAEVATLRWRPLHAPARGRHRCEVVAVDRAGNVGRRTGIFVLD